MVNTTGTMVSMAELRKGTSDWAIWHNITHHNEYKLPDRVNGTVIDVGAHIGAFSYEVCRRGAERVLAFEPDAENAAMFLRNTGAYNDRIKFVGAAVWGDYAGNLPLCNYPNENPGEINTGGRSAVFMRATGTSIVTCYSIEWVITFFGSWVDLLKLDCEGAEMSILSSPSISPKYVKKIIGEYHNVVGNPDHLAIHSRLLTIRNSNDIERSLKNKGYSVTITPHDNITGMFFAES